MSSDALLRVAVVGSGPAGFYAAGQLLASGAAVDLIERLPTPWGLVRFGVAPDHPEIKAVSRVFEKTAQKQGFRFFGNVSVGTDVTHEELSRLYDAVVYTVGAQTDRRLGIPGEDLPGSWPATAFVAWYNGHPDFQRLNFDLSSERAVVVGNGNVAVDVARMLCLTEEELAPTDTTDAAARAIIGSSLREVLMLGRRGPVQAAFTNPEVKELGEMAGADIVVVKGDLVLDEASAAELADERGSARRNFDMLREYSERPIEGKPRRLILRFLVSPVAILGDGKVEAIEIVRNTLVTDETGQIRAVASEQREQISCGLVLRSVGYRGVAIDGVPFDERRGVIPNIDGRVTDESGQVVAGLYTAGWIKRGPSGVIGTNKKDAHETVEKLLEDHQAGLLSPGEGDLASVLADRGIEVVDQRRWERINTREKALGEIRGKPRVKLVGWDELLGIATGSL